MRNFRLWGGALVAGLSLALVGGSPAHAVAPVTDPLATTVTGACAGGPGRMSLAVHLPAAGKYRVEVTARGLEEGSRWALQVVQEGDETSRVKDFRRVAVDGRWTVMTQFPASAGAERGEVFFNGLARERGDRGHSCFLLSLPGSPASGASTCNSDRAFVGLFARQRDDGSTVVDSLVFGARRDSRWHLTLTAIGAASRQMVEFDDYAERGGVVDSRVVFDGVRDPRLRLVATHEERGRCLIGLDPANVTTNTSLKSQGLDRLIASRT